MFNAQFEIHFIQCHSVIPPKKPKLMKLSQNTQNKHKFNVGVVFFFSKVPLFWLCSSDLGGTTGRRC